MTVPAAKPRMIRLHSIHIIRQVNRLRQINEENCAKIRELLVKLVDGEAWVDLGYKTLDEFARTEFKISRRTLERKYDAALILETIGLPVDSDIPDGTLEPLKPLSAPDRVDAWDQATEAAKGGTPSMAQVQRAVEEKQQQEERHVAEPIQTVTESVVGREPGDDDGEEEAEVNGYVPEPADLDDAAQEAEFIASLPLIEKLEPRLRDRYVAGALCWRRLENDRRRYQQRIREEFRKVQRACKGVEPKYVEKQLYAIRIRGALEWRLCNTCGGAGVRTVAGQSLGCASCDGHGVVV